MGQLADPAAAATLHSAGNAMAAPLRVSNAASAD